MTEVEDINSLRFMYSEMFPGLLRRTRGVSTLVYTVNFGNYDYILQGRPKSNIPHFYLSDSKSVPEGWILLHYDKKIVAEAWLNSRLLKLFPSIIFPDATSTLYVDSSFVFIQKPDEIFRDYEGKSLVLFKHPNRCSILQEITACKAQRKACLDDLNRFEEEIKGLCVGVTEGLYSAGFILRSHSTKVEECMCKWWELIIKAPRRDQLTLPLALRDTDISYVLIEKNIFFNTIAIPAPHKHSGNSLFIRFFIKLCVLRIKYALYNFLKEVLKNSHDYRT